MQIVIDIPEVFYEYCKAEEGAIEVHLAIKNGIVLPKGHGALKDIDMIYAKAQFYVTREFDGLLMNVNDLKNAPIIIPADKEED